MKKVSVLMVSCLHSVSLLVLLSLLCDLWRWKTKQSEILNHKHSSRLISKGLLMQSKNILFFLCG
jgi:hypothetical protein